METIFKLENLSKIYESRKNNIIHAVNNVSFSIDKGEVLGLIGESGCGKSTLGKLMLKLEKANEGKIIFNNEDITNLSFNKMHPVRKNMQMIFQNSIDSFNPYLTVRSIVLEPLENYSKENRIEKEKKARQILEEVGLTKEYLDRYGSELSGGQRQRVGIARALILNPMFVVCDEAVSALDYAVRNKILRLLYNLKKEKNLTYLFISHDLSAVFQICTRVVVMYMGKIMEILPNIEKENICHPYTKALLGAALGVNPRERNRQKVLFNASEQINNLSGCPFANRCLEAKKICFENEPSLKNIDEKGHCVSCHLINNTS